MWIRVEGGGSDNVAEIFFVIGGILKGSFGILKAYLVVFSLVLTKTETKNPAYRRQSISRPMRIVAPMP